MLAHFQNDRQRAAFIGLSAASLLCLAVAVASVAYQIGTISPGFVVWENLVVPAVTTGWSVKAPPVPFRSVLTHVDGERVRTATELRVRIAAAPAGTPFRYRFERAGQVEEVVLSTERLRWRTILPLAVPYLLNGTVLLGTGLVVFYFKPGLAGARAFVAPAMILGAMLLLALDAFSSFWFQRLCFALDSLLPGGLLHFALCFPDEKEVVRRHPALKRAVYAPFAVLAAMQNVFLTTSPENHLRVSDVVYASDAAAALAAALSLVLVVARSKDPIQRQQAKAVAAGFSLAIFVPALAILAVVLLAVEIPFNPLVIFLLVSPLSIGYAIARHNLFEVERFLRTGIVYAALSVVVFVSYAAVVLAGERWIGRGSGWSTGLVPIYILFVLAFAEPLRHRIQNAVDRLFYRQTYSYRWTIEETSRALAALLDTEQITSTVARTVTEVMAVEWAALAVFGSTPEADLWFGHPLAHVERLKRSLPPGDRTARTLAGARRLITRYDLTIPVGDLGNIDAAAIRGLEATLLIPMRFQNHPVGLLLVGEKRSGASYSDEDVQLLQTLANQAALALTNARAYEALRQTQAELVQAERLAAVGELAATVAHGIRNPLAGIRAAAQFGREELDSPQRMQESFDDIIRETDRLEGRVRAILDIARPLTAEIEPHRAGDLARDFVASVRHRIPPAVKLSLADESGNATIDVDRRQLDEVLDAIVNNAVEAMDGRGELRLRTFVEAREGHVSQVVFSLTDTGPGIDQARVGRIFDLFYTTKPAGTGVGLAMARRLVERLGGRIEVDSAPGQGATFRLCFPPSSHHAGAK